MGLRWSAGVGGGGGARPASPGAPSSRCGALTHIVPGGDAAGCPESLNPGLTQLHNWQLHKSSLGRPNRCFNPDVLLCGDLTPVTAVTQLFPKRGLKLQSGEIWSVCAFFPPSFSPFPVFTLGQCCSPSLWRIAVNHQWILLSSSLVVSAFKSISPLCRARLQPAGYYENL